MVSIKTKLPHQMVCIHCVISKNVWTILTELTQLGVPVRAHVFIASMPPVSRLRLLKMTGESFNIVRGCLSRTTRDTTN